MNSNLLRCLSLSGAAVLGFALSAQAGVVEPGSLLVFPCFNSHPGKASVISVTNTNSDLVNGSVDVEYVYINGDNCLEFNRTRTLTPNDTLTVVAHKDNPQQQEGYLYVFAKSHATGKAIKFDFLIGVILIASFDDSLNVESQPYVFKAGAALADGANTDLDNDGIRDLNGLEYEQAPDQILVPRFFGENDGVFETTLCLLNLTGGTQFTAIINFLIYNDNEEAFSAQYTFTCWDEVRLRDISSAFLDVFLKTTNENPSEIPGYPDTGPNASPETGWYRINGAVAFSSATSFNDPAILAEQNWRSPNVVDQRGGDLFAISHNAFGSIPFGVGHQANGDLLPQSVLGDNN